MFTELWGCCCLLPAAKDSYLPISPRGHSISWQIPLQAKMNGDRQKQIYYPDICHPATPLSTMSSQAPPARRHRHIFPHQPKSRKTRWRYKAATSIGKSSRLALEPDCLQELPLLQIESRVDPALLALQQTTSLLPTSAPRAASGANSCNGSRDASIV